eukprot:m.95030 g.95030  ORF g.95030 m.95030 type:complete len:256 (+) comp16580_c0_seq1:251-1018(+)
MAELKLKKSSEFTESHKSYSPIKPTCSKIIDRKFDDAIYQHHREKLRRVKPMIDNKAPASTKMSHVQVKLKSIQLKAERIAKIEHDNRNLLYKMSKIMNTTGALDNQNDYVKHSINRRTRQYELLKITQENQAILKRIQSRKPILDTVEMKVDYMKSRQYIDSITRFPPINRGSRRRSSGSRGSSDTLVPLSAPDPVPLGVETTDFSEAIADARAVDAAASEAEAEEDVGPATGEEKDTQPLPENATSESAEERQ